MKRFPLFLAGFFASINLWAAPEPRFSFMPPWDDASPGITNMSGLLEKPAGSHGFVVAKDGHLFAGGKRIRFFGVNTAFGANFPTHADAEKVAARMAKFGINCVRFHHMDWNASPTGIWSADKRTLDAEQLDKLDYFIAQLKANGIYADLNLHVSRAYPGMLKWEKAPSFGKGLDNFYPPFIEMQRDYARQLLQHVNPYTKTAYAEEPAVAFVEINNENGLICEWWSGSLDNMPELYRSELDTQWNRWLKTKYPTDADVQKVWNAAGKPLGEEMLREGNFADGLGAAWFLEHHEGAEVEVSGLTSGSSSGSGLHISVKKPGSLGWHVQLSQSKLALVQDMPYTLTFRARAVTKTGKAPLQVVASQTHSPWTPFWSATADVTPEWKDYRFTLQPSGSDTEARIVFSNMGATEGEYDFADVSLRPGGEFGLQKGEHLGTVPFIKKSALSERSLDAQRDWMQFLTETEEGYWTGMQRFLKEEIKTRSLIVGTATGFSPTSIQAKLDVVDVHAYWQHPRFPHKDWDPENWTVGNVSMAGVPNGGELPGLATRRVAGKPYICTEYNGAAPNTTTAETYLLINAFAALQDWDAVFAFAYSHRLNEWDYKRIPGFFDIDQHPTKLATLPAAVAMFVRGDVARAGTTTTVPASPQQTLDATRRHGPWWNAGAFSAEKLPYLESVIQMDFRRGKSETPKPQQSAPPQMVWNSAQSCVTVNAPRSKAFIGKGPRDAVALGDVSITASQEWSAITLTAMDAQDFHSPGRILITAVGAVENTGMGWKDAKKNSVGKNWGSAPVQAEGIVARITLPLPAAKLKAWALDERGQRNQEIKVQPEGKTGVLELGAKYQTLWYEVDALP